MATTSASKSKALVNKIPNGNNHYILVYSDGTAELMQVKKSFTKEEYKEYMQNVKQSFPDEP